MDRCQHTSQPRGARRRGGRQLIARGDIWWSEDQVLGRRPVLVLSRNAVLSSLGRPLVAPLTTRRRGIPTEVSLDVDDGVAQPCVVSLDNVQPLARAVLVERITRLGPERMGDVCEALAAAVECD